MPPLKNLVPVDSSVNKGKIDIIIGEEQYYRFIYGSVIRR